MKKRIYCIILATALAAGGCASPFTDSSYSQGGRVTEYPLTAQSRAAEPGKTGAYGDTFQKNWHLSGSNMFDGGCGSEDGYYFWVNKFVYYVDKETLASIILCGRPECTHQDENCNAYVGASFHLCYQNGKIYYDITQEQGRCLFQMNADGTAHKMLGVLRTDGFISDVPQFLVDGDNVLFKSENDDIRMTQLSGKWADAAMLKNNGRVTADNYTAPQAELWDLWEDEDRYYCMGNPEKDGFTQQLFEYDPAKGSMDKVWEAPEKGSSVNGWYLDNGVLNYYSSDRGICQWDRESGETVVLAAVTGHKGPAMLDGRLCFLRDENGEQLYIYDMAGVLKGTYTIGKGDFRIIGTNEKYIFLNVQIPVGGTQDAMKIENGIYYLERQQAEAGTGEFQQLLK